MPRGSPGSLGGAEYAQIIAYVLQQNGYATGRKEVLLRTLGGAQASRDDYSASALGPACRGGGLAAGVTLPPAPKKTNPLDKITPVTDTLVQNPPAGEWLTWRRGFDYQGFSPLKQDR